MPRAPDTMDTFLVSHLTDSSSSTASEIEPRRFSDDHYIDDEALVSLIKWLSYLEELDLIMRSQLPAALQQAICEYHPDCRLNIWSEQDLSLLSLH
ncbi:uncharacterized protein BDV17DRAFT_117477 [Aspergillus undulatus]|uniref:uncharacterized protein n=1 Tax=Aspergillus undulatus TaxID=1810928 RepID=UPI003CCCC2E5